VDEMSPSKKFSTHFDEIADPEIVMPRDPNKLPKVDLEKVIHHFHLRCVRDRETAQSDESQVWH
jgi:hypothetical protein